MTFKFFMPWDVESLNDELMQAGNQGGLARGLRNVEAMRAIVFLL